MLSWMDLSIACISAKELRPQAVGIFGFRPIYLYSRLRRMPSQYFPDHYGVVLFGMVSSKMYRRVRLNTTAIGVVEQVLITLVTHTEANLCTLTRLALSLARLVFFSPSHCSISDHGSHYCCMHPEQYFWVAPQIISCQVYTDH